MRAAAYCRVSTKQEEQLDSLESQQKFFLEYAVRNEYELVHIYADEGKSGTKMKNRTQLLNLLKDAARGEFDLLLIKDISRLARNTVDFLTSIRRLKAWGIKVIFVNYDQTSSESSEFMLTMLSAIAQEESANTSKRVKFGKKQNARLGRVPNLVYGYDKIPGEYFDLRINEKEAEVVRRIFGLYIRGQKGASKIAEILNNERIKTKKGCDWNQTSICRILDNEIYIGKVINGKEEIEDFLTGKRMKKEEENWLITNKPELMIIDEETFAKAQKIKTNRRKDEKAPGIRESGKHPFSQLIICSECRGYFRRLSRTYKNTIITWVCGTRNKSGANSCANALSLREEELINALHGYFAMTLKENPAVAEALLKEGKILELDETLLKVQDIKKNIGKKEKERNKYIELYTCEVITLTELKLYTDKISNELNGLKEQLKSRESECSFRSGNGKLPEEDSTCKVPECQAPEDKSMEGEAANVKDTEDKILKSYIRKTFSDNINLKRILDRIEADGKGNIIIEIKKLTQKQEKV